MSIQFELERVPDHHYRTEIPNIIRELGLNPYDLAAYFHVKSIAGDAGSCFKCLKKLSEQTCVGETRLRESLNNLCEGKNKLNLKLLKKIMRKKEDGSPETTLYIVLDIWQINGDYYRSKKKLCASPHEGGVPRQMREGTSPNTDKEEPNEEEHLDGLEPAAQNETIFYKNRNKSLKSITRSEIHRHLLGKHSPEIINAAIEKFQKLKTEVGDSIKLIGIMAGQIAKKAQEVPESKKPLTNPNDEYEKRKIEAAQKPKWRFT